MINLLFPGQAFLILNLKIFKSMSAYFLREVKSKSLVLPTLREIKSSKFIKS